jgi:hypothetical protein
MNRYILIRRLRGPAFLLLVGTLALLNQADILSWGHSWPLFLILAGVMALAERAALATDPPAPYPGAPYAVDPNVPGGPIPAGTSSAIVPAHTQEYEKEPDGGQQ